MNSVSTFFKIGFIEKEKQNPKRSWNKTVCPVRNYSEESSHCLAWSPPSEDPLACSIYSGQLLGTHWAPAGQRPKYSSVSFTFLLAQECEEKTSPENDEIANKH